MPEKNPKVKLGQKNSAMLPSYFDYSFVHLRQKVRFKPEIFVNFRPEFRPEPDPKNPARLTTLSDSAFCGVIAANILILTLNLTSPSL